MFLLDGVIYFLEDLVKTSGAHVIWRSTLPSLSAREDCSVQLSSNDDSDDHNDGHSDDHGDVIPVI